MQGEQRRIRRDFISRSLVHLRGNSQRGRILRDVAVHGENLIETRADERIHVSRRRIALRGEGSAEVLVGGIAQCAALFVAREELPRVFLGHVLEVAMPVGRVGERDFVPPDTVFILCALDGSSHPAVLLDERDGLHGHPEKQRAVAMPDVSRRQRVDGGHVKVVHKNPSLSIGWFNYTCWILEIPAVIFSS